MLTSSSYAGTAGGLVSVFQPPFFPASAKHFLSPFFLRELELKAGEFGTIYSLATLGSALLLPYLGALYDRAPLHRYAGAVVLGLGLACLSIASAFHVVMLWVGLWGLRLCGQGLLTHVSMTTMAHTPAGYRGKALGAASLGYPGGEAFLPPLAALAIVWFGWRETWTFAALFSFLILLPLVLWLAKPLPFESGGETPSSKERHRGAAWWLFRSPAFLCILPSVFALAAISTALFLYQLAMAEAKGWRPEWIAGGFALFAVTRAITSILAGSWLDRVGAMPLLPLGLLPYAGGLVLLLATDEAWIIPLYLPLFGVTFGLVSVVKTAIWVELYGTGELGAIRSMLATLMTLGTAVSPVVIGFLLDAGLSFRIILGLSLGIVILVTLPLLAVPRLPGQENPSSTKPL